MENLPYIGMDAYYELNYLDFEAIQKKLIPLLKKKQNGKLFVFGLIVTLITASDDEDKKINNYQSAKFTSLRKMSVIDIIDSIKKLSLLNNRQLINSNNTDAKVAIKVDFMINKPLRINAKTGLLTATDSKFNSNKNGLLVVFKDVSNKTLIYFPKSFDKKKKWPQILLEILKSKNKTQEILKGAKFFAFKTVSYQKSFFELFASKNIISNIGELYSKKIVYAINNPYLKQIPYILNKSYDYKHNPNEYITNLQFIYHTMKILNYEATEKKKIYTNKIKNIINKYISKSLVYYEDNKKKNNLLLPSIVLVITAPLVEYDINVRNLVTDLIEKLKNREDDDIDLNLILTLNAISSVKPLNMSIIIPEIKKINSLLKLKMKSDKIYKKINLIYDLTLFLINLEKNINPKNYPELIDLYEILQNSVSFLKYLKLNMFETNHLCKIFCIYVNLYNLISILGVKISKYDKYKLEELILTLFTKLEKHKNEHGFYKFIINNKGVCKLSLTSMVVDSLLKFKSIYL